MAESSFLRILKSLFGASDAPAPEPRTASATAPDPPSLTSTVLDVTRVPAAAQERVATIQTMLADLEQRAVARGMAGADLTELTQIATVYLPRLLASYAAIPPEHRAEIFRDTGRSASFLLVERLDRIVARLGEISKDFARGHIDAFSDNRASSTCVTGHQPPPSIRPCAYQCHRL